MAAIRAGDIEWLVGADLKGFRKALDDAEAAVKGLGDKIGEQTQKYGVAFTAAGAAVTGAMGLMAKSAADFESGLTKLSTLGIQNQADMQRIEETVRSLATTYNTDLADGMEGAFTALSLFGTTTEGVTQAIAFMEANAQAATAGYTGFADIVSTSTSIISGFQLAGTDAADVLDKVSMAANISLVDVDDLAQVVGRLVPSFSSAKVSMEEMLAAVAVSTNVNQNASEVTVGLINTIKAITKPAQEVRKDFDALGISWGASALEGKGLAGWLDELRQKTQGNEQALMDLFPDMEAYRGIQILLTVGTDKLTEATEKVAAAHGTVAENLAKVLENDPTVQWGLLTKQLKDLAISIGQALLPALRSITENLTLIVNSIREWTRQHPELTANLVQGVAALGAFSLGLGTLLLAVKPLIMGIEALIFVFKAVPVAFGLLTSPAAAVVAALASIGYAAYTVYENWDELWPAITELAINAWETIQSAAGEAMDYLVNLLKQDWEALKLIWSMGTEGIKAIWGTLWQGIRDIASTALQMVTEPFEGFSEFVSEWVDTITSYFNNLLESAGNIWDSISDAITGPIDYVWEQMSSFGSYMKNAFGMSEWIDYMENLARESGSNFGEFKDHVTGNLDQTTERMDEFGKDLDRFYTGVLGKWRGIKMEFTERISDFQGIMDAAIERLGSYEAVVHHWLDYTVREQRRVILGFEANFRSMSDWIREILGITEEGIQAHLDGLDKGVAYIKDTLSDTWIQLSDDAEDNAAKVVSVIKSMSDKTGGSLRTVSKEAENAYKALAKLTSAGGSIPGHAAGGVTKNALVMVGERGPELAALPVGTRVLSHADMMAAASLGIRGYASGGVVNQYPSSYLRYLDQQKTSQEEILAQLKRLLQQYPGKYGFGDTEQELRATARHFAIELKLNLPNTEALGVEEFAGDVEQLQNQILRFEESIEKMKAGIASGVLTEDEKTESERWLEINEEALAEYRAEWDRTYGATVDYSDQISQVSEETLQMMSLMKETVAGLTKTWTESWRKMSSETEKAGGVIQRTISSVVSGIKLGLSSLEGFWGAAKGGASGYAAGGVTDHAMVMVGERGPELAALPVGTRILSHSDMMAAVTAGVRGYAGGGVVEPAYLTKLTAERLAWWEKFKKNQPPRFSWQTDMVQKELDKRKGNSLWVRNFLGDVQGTWPGLKGADQNYFAHWLSWKVNNASPDRSVSESTGGGNRRWDQGGGGSGGGGYGGWMPRTRNELLDLGIFTFSERLGGLTAQAVGGGGGSQSGSSSTAVTISAPLVRVDRIDARDQANVDKFLEKLTAAFLSRLSAAGLNLNGV